MEREYEFLCEFSNNTHPAKRHLVRRYGKKALDEAIEEMWIFEYGKNEADDVLYAITRKGKERRDK